MRAGRVYYPNGYIKQKMDKRRTPVHFSSFLGDITKEMGIKQVNYL